MSENNVTMEGLTNLANSQGEIIKARDREITKLNLGFANAVFEWKKIVAEKDRQIAELKEQLDKAIVPKFKEGQEVYLINKKTNCIQNWKIDYIVILEDYLLYDLIDGDFMKHSKEQDIFATREEAEQALDQLKGEKQ